MAHGVWKRVGEFYLELKRKKGESLSIFKRVFFPSFLRLRVIAINDYGRVGGSSG